MENYCLDYFNHKKVFRRVTPVMKPTELFAQYLNSLKPYYFDVI